MHGNCLRLNINGYCSVGGISVRGRKNIFGSCRVMWNELTSENKGTGAVSLNKAGAVAEALFYVHVAVCILLFIGAKMTVFLRLWSVVWLSSVPKCCQ